MDLFLENNPITPKIDLHPSQTCRYLNKKYSNDIMKFGAFHTQWIKQISEGFILCLLQQNVAQIQSDWFCATWCYDKILLWGQKFFQKFSSTCKVICRCNLLPWLVAATCCLVHSIPKVFKCCFWKTFTLNANFRTKCWERRYYM